VLEHVAHCDMAYLDVDKRTAPRWTSIITTLRFLHMRPLWAEYQRTARGWHIRIALVRAIQPGELIALQVLLGSDVRREMSNLLRVLAIRRNSIRGWPASRWNILYRRKLR